MIVTIKYIADYVSSSYQRGTFGEFLDWIHDQDSYQLDIETDITKWWCTRKLISLQFGSCNNNDRTQWFIQWSDLSKYQQQMMKEVLEDSTKLKLIHNAQYEYVVLRFYDIILENVYDTMVAEKVLKGGLEDAGYSLPDLCWRYLRMSMDKTEQTQFGDNIINDSKVLYGITDVAYLDTIRDLQVAIATKEKLLKVFELEMEAVLAFSDITFNGMILDKEKWRENIRLAEPVVEAAKEKMNGWLKVEPFRTKAINKGYISDTDTIIINWNAPQQKKELLQLIFPDIEGASLPIIKKYLRDNAMALDDTLMNILMDVKEKESASLQKYLLANYRGYLLEHGYLIEAGTATINWNSTDQMLPMAQLVEPKLKSLAEDAVAKTTHPILKDRAKYVESLKLLTSLGEPFIEKYCAPDGKVRTEFNQVLVTGRCSSARPNMQNITVTEEVGTRYRNAFTTYPGWEFVDSDYVSQELVIIAYISKDPVWMEAIEKGWDLHSICAELLYGYKWKEAAESTCAYYHMTINAEGKLIQDKQKCSCKKHKVLRYDIKSVNFGLAYGMSEFKLAGELNISVKDARNLMNRFFTVFPLIARTLDFLGNFGVENGYIMTLAPFHRKRWFPYWEEHKHYIEMHKQGIKYVPLLGEIERAAKNMPIQGSSADITKVALVKIRHHVRDNKLWNSLQLVAQVHDQVTTVCKKELTATWLPIMDKLMCDAGKVVIPTGILRAETLAGPVWTK